MTPRVIAVSNHKGGVGKSTMVHTLGDIAATSGRRVVLVDMDAQGNLTRMCVGDKIPASGVADVLAGSGRSLGIRQVVHKVKANLSLVAGGPALVRTEIDLLPRVSRELALAKALGDLRDTDLVIIDTPPSASVLVTNALAAAEEVIIPVQAQELDMHGLTQFLGSIREVRAVNPGLRIGGIVVTFFAGRTNEHKNNLQELRDSGLPICRTSIGRAIRISEASRKRCTIMEWPDNPQAIAYMELARELRVVADRKEKTA